VQKKYHRSLTPLAWLEASGGTALSMDPMAEKYGFKQSGISISSEPLCNLPVRHRRGLGRMAYDEATESTKTKFRSGMELSRKGEYRGEAGGGDEFHGFMQLDEWLNCRK